MWCCPLLGKTIRTLGLIRDFYGASESELKPESLKVSRNVICEWEVVFLEKLIRCNFFLCDILYEISSDLTLKDA